MSVFPIAKVLFLSCLIVTSGKADPSIPKKIGPLAEASVEEPNQVPVSEVMPESPAAPATEDLPPSNPHLFDIPVPDESSVPDWGVTDNFVDAPQPAIPMTTTTTVSTAIAPPDPPPASAMAPVPQYRDDALDMRTPEKNVPANGTESAFSASATGE